jgi:large subunit ribosomal protein L22
MAYKYSTPLAEKSARAVGIQLPISRKVAIEICNAIRGKNIEFAKKLLDSVIAGKQAIAYKRFNGDVGHRKGNMAAGRYPMKASAEILNIIKSAEANAQYKELMVKNLVISHISAKNGVRQFTGGRSRTLNKRTHIEVVVQEKQ